MKRIGILTAGGDTPALNATIHGAVTRANQLRMEVIGLMKGFNSLFNAQVPHVHLNPLYQTIPELDPTQGGTVLGASRDYINADDHASLDAILQRLHRLKIEGLICIGGDGTLNGMQPLAERLPSVLAPKTIDNDLGLNYRTEPDEWRRKADGRDGFSYSRGPARTVFDLEQMINYVTPGFATSVYVSAMGVMRVRTTAESHRRIAIIEVMGRHSGYVALGSMYGQPDIILVPEYPLDADSLAERVKEIYDLQKHVLIVCGEGIVDPEGRVLGAERSSTDPAGNVLLSGAAEALRQILIERIGDEFFRARRRGNSAREAIFTRKIGHTQRGGRPLLFDRFYAAQLGGKAVDILAEGQNNLVSILQWNQKKGFHVASFEANSFRDRWGLIHARTLHPSFYDAHLMKPSRVGVEYLLNIFTGAIGQEDMEYIRQKIFDPGNLTEPYHSVNNDIAKRIQYLRIEKT
ncbi:MAG TPA: 6-phosphofructokinase [Candidatus Paceibacterota bacterium]|nr:6-phosphofructokinase [Verrucomicrobiota bacterium]HRY50906.1 6-phosphofructokinase [Candidatus Paceibacterota bacterium]